MKERDGNRGSRVEHSTETIISTQTSKGVSLFELKVSSPKFCWTVHKEISITMKRGRTEQTRDC